MRAISPSRSSLVAVQGFLVVLVVAALFGAGCSRKKEKEANATATPTASKDAGSGSGSGSATPAATPPIVWYRVEVIADVASSVPFFLGIDQKADRAVIDNGEEQLEAILLSREPLKVRIAVLAGEVTLKPEGASGNLRGEWTAKTLIKEPFRVEATRVDAPSPKLRFPGDEPPGGSIAGSWRVEMADFGIGRGVFRQDEAGNLTGALIPPDVGDTRYLSGRVIGDKFVLSTFDGMHAHLVEGTLEAGGKELKGRWVAAGFGEWAFTAKRADEPSALSLVTPHMKKGQTRVSVPALAKPPYAGQPVVIDFFGTWCSACMDLMPQLLALEKKYADQGLKVMFIALEPAGDDAEGNRRIEELRKKYGITGEIDVRFRDDLLADIPPEIDNAQGFPLTIFVRRDGTVAALHSAFISEAARPENQTIRERFEAMAKEIVASPAAPVGKAPKRKRR